MDMTATSGEAYDYCRTERQLHGGRQEGKYKGTGIWNTGGCYRGWDNNVKTLKSKITELETNNPDELKSRTITSENDLAFDKTTKRYFTPDDMKNLLSSRNDLATLKQGYAQANQPITADQAKEFQTKITEAENKVSTAEKKGIDTSGK